MSRGNLITVAEAWAENKGEFTEPNSEWAEWYAHVVLTDQWPNAEDLISESPDSQFYYAQFKRTLKMLGMLNHTVGTAAVQKATPEHKSEAKVEVSAFDIIDMIESQKKKRKL